MYKAINPIEVWSLRFPDLEMDRNGCMERLSDDERQRAGRYLRPQDAGRFILARGTLRTLLGQKTDADPSKLLLRNTPHGKPYLPDSPLRFNLSHSRDRLLIALTHDHDIGVDIEFHRRGVPSTAIADRWFTASERARLHRHAEPSRLFFDFWACKEAYVKAIGRGIYKDFASFELPLDLPSLEPVSSQDGNWVFQSLPVATDFSAALVAPSPAHPIRLYTHIWENRY